MQRHRTRLCYYDTQEPRQRVRHGDNAAVLPEQQFSDAKSSLYGSDPSEEKADYNRSGEHDREYGAQHKNIAQADGDEI